MRTIQRKALETRIRRNLRYFVKIERILNTFSCLLSLMSFAASMIITVLVTYIENKIIISALAGISAIAVIIDVAFSIKRHAVQASSLKHTLQIILEKNEDGLMDITEFQTQYYGCLMKPEPCMLVNALACCCCPPHNVRDKDEHSHKYINSATPIPLLPVNLESGVNTAIQLPAPPDSDENSENTEQSTTPEVAM